jgi:catalase
VNKKPIAHNIREADIMNEEKVLTTNQGFRSATIRIRETAGERGPVLLQDVRFIEKMAHFDRERIPERVVHARGAGA